MRRPIRNTVIKTVLGIVLCIALLSGAASAADLAVEPRLDLMPPHGEEDRSPCAQLKAWYQEHGQTGGTYRLTEDIVVEQFLSLKGSADAPITIDTGPYHIYVDSWHIFSLEGATIIGDGGEEGVVQVRSGTLEFHSGTIEARNGTALRLETESRLSYYLGETDRRALKASGNRAVALDASVYTCPLQMHDTCVIAEGPQAIGIKLADDLRFLRGTICAQGEGARSIVSQNLVEIRYSEAVIEPEAIGLTVLPAYDKIEGIDSDAYVILSKDTPLADVPLPTTLKAHIHSTDGKYVQTQLRVEWDTSDYQAHAASGDNFRMPGRLLDIDQYEVDETIKPQLSIEFREPGPATLQAVVQTGFRYVVVLLFDTPFDADEIYAEYCENGGEWVTTALTEDDLSGDRTTSYCYDFDACIPREFRIRVKGGLYDGISNSIALPLSDEQADPNISESEGDQGGTRGPGNPAQPKREAGAIPPILPLDEAMQIARPSTEQPQSQDVQQAGEAADAASIAIPSTGDGSRITATLLCCCAGITVLLRTHKRIR